MDGIAGIAADPYGALEGVNDIVRKPEEAVSVILKEVKEYVNTNVIEGTAESRARVAGALAFEVLSAVITSGGTPAAKAAKAGDKAGELGRTARVSDRISDMGKTAKGLVTDKAEKLLTSPKVGKLADYMDDVLDGLCNKMGMRKTPWTLSPADAPISGIGDTKYFGQLYEELLKKQALNESRNGVKINKAADIADDVGDAGRAAGKGIAFEGGNRAEGIGRTAYTVQYGDQYTKVGRKKVLKPNVQYMDSNSYKYTTDGCGRISKVEGELQLKSGTRNPYAQRTVGGNDRLPTDDGGHLIGTQFNGSG